MASSSSSLLRTCKYRVFVSFHGQDVRKTFLSHLRKQLNDDGITMYDDQEMERGATIGHALMQGISESRISIVVLSKNYASSSWCLDELLEIFKCKEEIGQILMTVFYGVDPSDVRNKTGDFGTAFNETCVRKKDEEKRRQWSQALEDVGNIAGEHFQKWDNESKMIEKIARDVSNKINNTSSWDFEDMVGIEAHLEKMQSLLRLDKEDEVMVVGICGPAGIGKTTIARAFHSRFSCSFCLTCFMENLRGIYNSGHNEYGSKLCLQEKLLSKILNQDGMRVNDLGAIRKRLCDQKVLIILDDVDDLKQLEALVDETWFGPGSRIIVTTEDRELLGKHDINIIYHVAFPTKKEARMIFCRNAFRKSPKPDGFEKLIERVTEICSKLPLGLRVMGSYLCKKTKDDWEDILQGLENSFDPVEQDIERVLRVGYDSLRVKDQLLFLLIAVYFNYKDDGHLKGMLAGNKLNVRLGLKTLANKSLIQESIEGNIVMHKLLQQVGREAIQRQDPRQRQILIDTDDILEFLENESDRRSVIGISLDMSTIPPTGVYINARAFKNIPNLEFISFYKSRLDTNVRVHVPEDMDFPHRLKLLHWDAYPVKCLPRTFRPEFLVELKLMYNNLEKLWEGIQPIANLKKMDLSSSFKLKELPDLSNAKKLETLTVSNCFSLVELPASIANLDKLEQLEMQQCMMLQVVPTNINLASLHDVSMWGCMQLRKIPDIARNITKLEIADTMLEEVSDSIRFCRLKNLSIMGSIKGKDYDGIEKIPDWIKDLHQLVELDISNCRKLVSLPELPASLLFLNVNTCELLETLISFPVDSSILNLCFPNCFKLDGEARRVITQHFLLKACLPGRTIPVEFNQRASVNSLTIRSDFSGFKLCVVVSPNQQMDESDLLYDGILLCDIRINGCPVEKSIYHDVNMIQTEHLCMSSVFFDNEDEGWRDQDNEILFEFSTTSHEVRIIECGVQTLTDEILKTKLLRLEKLREESLLEIMNLVQDNGQKTTMKVSLMEAMSKVSEDLRSVC